MTTHDMERSPLLARDEASKDGPLECREISTTTRYGILIALWAGTFLCVSDVPFESRVVVLELLTRFRI